MDEKQQKVELSAAHARSAPPSSWLVIFLILVGLGFIVYGAVFHTIPVRMQEATASVAPDTPAAAQLQDIHEPALVREITRRPAAASALGRIELGTSLPACPT